MDEEKVKLLLLLEGRKFLGLITIGDIQRGIIKNIPLDTLVGEIKRTDIHIAFVGEELESIKQRMIRERDECMPIIDREGYISDVIFWDDLFKDVENRNTDKLDIPVVIMAGGKGLRMRPLTNVIPKPLIPVGDSTICEKIIGRFRQIGIQRFYMSVNYKADMIEFYFKDKVKDYDLNYFRENRPLGTAGSLYLLKDIIKTTFFVTNCDIIVEQDYREIYDFHRVNGNDITMVCAIKSIFIPYGTAQTGMDGRLIEMKEKPEIVMKINTGMYLLEPELLQEIPQDRVFHITELIEQVKNRGGKVCVFPVAEGQYYDIGEWAFYKNTLEVLK